MVLQRQLSDYRCDWVMAKAVVQHLPLAEGVQSEGSWSRKILLLIGPFFTLLHKVEAVCNSNSNCSTTDSCKRHSGRKMS